MKEFSPTVQSRTGSEQNDYASVGSNAGLFRFDEQVIMRALLTIDETADFIGLSSWTVRYMIRKGSLPCLKIGRRVLIERTALDKLIADSRQVR